MSACGRHLVIQKTTEHVRAYRAFCKEWRCPQCAKRLRRKLHRRILCGEPNMLLTLTCAPLKGETRHEQAQRMSRAWERFIKRIKRYLNVERLPYVRVFEAHVSGRPHIHAALRSKFIPWKWLSKQWKQLTGSPGVDVRRIRNQGQAAHYVTKYITGSLELFEGVTRFACSRDWDLAPKTRLPRDWSSAETRVLKHFDLGAWTILLQQDGWQNIRAGPHYVEADPPQPGQAPPLWDCAVEPPRFPRRRKWEQGQQEDAGLAGALTRAA